MFSLKFVGNLVDFHHGFHHVLRENPWKILRGPQGVAALPVEFPHGGGAKGVRPEVLGPAGRCWAKVCQNEDQNAILGEKWGEER